MTLSRASATVLPLILASAALAQPNVGGTITDGLSVFRIDLGSNASAAGTGATTFFSVNGPGGPNHLFRGWWWQRVDGPALPASTREEAVFRPAANTTISMPAGNQLRITYNYGSYLVIMQWTVAGFQDGFGQLTQTMAVQNLDFANPITVNLFNYNDVDVFGTPGNDSASLTGPNTVQLADGTFLVVRASYEGSAQIRSDLQPNVLNLLTNAAIDNLAGGVVNGGPGDLEVGSQFTFTLSPGGVQSVSTTLTIVPTPGSVALAALGGLALIGRRRRQ